MEALFSSLLLVALGEIGDKTQLLSLALILKFRKPWPILAGVVVATLLNHGASVWFGDWLADTVPMDWMRWILGISFMALGLWMLIPDGDEEIKKEPKYGPFLTALVLFFIAAMALAFRAPFDLPTAPGELGGGVDAEYTGVRLGVLRLARLTLVITLASATTVFYLGGWHGPLLLAWAQPLL